MATHPERGASIRPEKPKISVNLPEGVKHPAIEAVVTRWREAQAHSHHELLRTCLLREMAQTLHREKNKGHGGSTQALEQWLRSLSVELDRPLDAATFEEILPALNRPDRKWDRIVASAAQNEGWHLGTVLGWIRVDAAQRFHQSWSHHDWAQQLVLFVESGPDLSAAPQGLWQGAWHMLHAPHHPIDLEVFKKIPGYSSTPAPATWHAVE